MQSPLRRLRYGLARIFFRCFFRVLLLLVSIAQWGCLWWGLSGAATRSLPVWAHVAGPALFYALNRLLVWVRPASPGVVSSALRVYSATAFVSIFCAGFLAVGLLLWGAAWLVVGAIAAQALTAVMPAAPPDLLDDVFRNGLTLGMSGIGLLFAYGYLFGQRRLEVTRLRIPMIGHARGVRRVVQISDIHIGRNLTLRELRHFVDIVNALDADLVCVTGDIADSPFADYDTFFPVLGDLRARCGVVAILGNHDHAAGAERVVRELRRHTPFRVLRDQACTIDLGGLTLHVIGLDDRGPDWARGYPTDAVLRRLLAAAPAELPVLLLAHRPDVFTQAAGEGVALTLSGHTHGGQLALPWLGGRYRNLAEFITPYNRGHYERGGCNLYVNSGLGVTGQKVRLFTPREITVLELSGDGSAAHPPAVDAVGTDASG